MNTWPASLMSDREDDMRSGEEDEDYMSESEEEDEEKETMVLNPTNVRERIDSALETLRYIYRTSFKSHMIL